MVLPVYFHDQKDWHQLMFLRGGQYRKGKENTTIHAGGFGESRQQESKREPMLSKSQQNKTITRGPLLVITVTVHLFDRY